MTRPVALVTGARRGIGKAIALELARRGHDLALTDHVLDDEARQVRQDCESVGAAVQFYQHDSADVDAHPALIDMLYQFFGRLDVVVNSAGIGAPVRGDLLELVPAHFDRVMDVNLRGAVFLCQAAAKRMVAVRSDIKRSFILVTSVSAQIVSPDRADYCMSKAGLSMFARALALRLAGEDIAVFEVRPGIIRTSMTEGVAAKYETAIAGGLVPMPRWGQPEDIASSVAALVSGAFHFATGSVLQVDGGLSIQKL
jgi:3-oxoacyl-[acyl-carrier protein] reductase